MDERASSEWFKFKATLCWFFLKSFVNLILRQLGEAHYLKLLCQAFASSPEPGSKLLAIGKIWHRLQPMKFIAAAVSFTFWHGSITPMIGFALIAISNTIRDSIVVSIPACHAGDRGSIPRHGDVLSFVYCEFTHIDAWGSSLVTCITCIWQAFQSMHNMFSL